MLVLPVGSPVEALPPEPRLDTGRLLTFDGLFATRDDDGGRGGFIPGKSEPQRGHRSCPAGIDAEHVGHVIAFGPGFFDPLSLVSNIKFYIINDEIDIYILLIKSLFHSLSSLK
jgi:hypothetical protein